MTTQELEQPSPAMSARGANGDDELSNSDGPLIATKKKNNSRGIKMNSPAMLLQDSWHKSKRCEDEDEDGKKSHRCIWTLSVVLGVVGLCNLLLNLTILTVLRVGRGMESMEMIPEENLMKLYGNADLDRVCLHRGACEGFGDKPVELVGNDAGIKIQVASPQHSLTSSSMRILENGTSVTRVTSFQVKDPRGGPLFSTDFPNFRLPQGVERVELEATQTHRIAAPKRSDLTVRSDESISLHGAEGASSDSKDVALKAKKDVVLRSKNGDIVVEAKEAIAMPRIPVAVAAAAAPSELADQYKVCVCMPGGKVFLVPVGKSHARVNCAKASRAMDSDPCAM